MQQLEMIFIKFLFCKTLALCQEHIKIIVYLKKSVFLYNYFGFLSCIIPSAEYIISPAHIKINVISIFVLKYS